MADIDFDDFEDSYPVARSAAAGRWVQLAGAACSVCLVLGLVVWGYKLAVRDVTGIPVVRALEGPLRIAPDNPGGNVAMHQGLSVNAVAAVGTAAPLPATVTLAPAEMALDEEDAAGIAVLASTSSRLPAAAQPSDVSVNIAAPAAVDLKPMEVAAQPVPEDIAVDQPIPETEQDAVAAALAIALADDGTVEADEPVNVVAKSVRPMARPARASAAAVGAETTVASEVTAAQAEVDAATIPAGTLLVQLGAFDDEAGARAEWGNLQARFPELIGSKAMVVQPAQSGGRTFYRLRAHGFASDDETRRFCAAVLAENAKCIAVAQR